MPAYAATKSGATRSRINYRLVIPKLLFVPAIAFALVSQHVYVEDGFWDTTWEVLSLIILLVAVLGRVWTSAYISGRKNHELVVDGPYSLTRNPLYFFSFLGYVGAGLAFEKLTVCFAFAVVFVLSHWPTILKEERKLREKFGEKYQTYAQQVPRFWPRFARINFPSSVTFSPKSFNRAVVYSGFIMCAYVLAHLIEYGQNTGIIPILIRNVP
ncbi:MAG TPA: isoprenylcysteine carboxylmethyltransferase family protein [Lacipirellulaceae bacterium]|nr:isoprenylcysteine carboxylmethyltransferase family protein [Lacipirellulaceae bacterium]